MGAACAVGFALHSGWAAVAPPSHRDVAVAQGKLRTLGVLSAVTKMALVPPALVELAVLHSQTLHVRIYFECVVVGLDPLFTPEPRHHLI